MYWFRPGLRVKHVQGTVDIYEMTWAPDGRALFTFGEDVISGKRHVVWASKSVLISIPALRAQT